MHGHIFVREHIESSVHTTSIANILTNYYTYTRKNTPTKVADTFGSSGHNKPTKQSANGKRNRQREVIEHRCEGGLGEGIENEESMQEEKPPIILYIQVNSRGRTVSDE